jgi:serine/threonine protein kinase
MADPSRDPRLGAVLAGYRIDARVGRGGMGVVYRAHHLNLGRRAAIKIIAPELADAEGFHARFIREARIAAALEHPNVVTVYDAGEADGLLSPRSVACTASRAASRFPATPRWR